MKPGTVCVGFLDDEHWSASFGLSYMGLILTDMTRPERVLQGFLRKFCASGGIVTGRNETAQKFLDTTDCEWLFTIDTDMSFGPSTVDDLVQSAADADALVVGGLCFSAQGVGHGDLHTLVSHIFPTVYDWNENDTTAGFQIRPFYDRDTLQPCAATGAACMLIHRSALERVRDKFGDHWYDPILHDKAPSGVFGEDLSFCMRLAACEIQCWVNSAVKTAHHKGQGHYLDESAFDRQVIAIRAEAAEFFEAYSTLLTFAAAKRSGLTLDGMRAELARSA